jgi:hypothetical protein
MESLLQSYKNNIILTREQIISTLNEIKQQLPETYTGRNYLNYNNVVIENLREFY